MRSILRSTIISTGLEDVVPVLDEGLRDCELNKLSLELRI